MSVDEIIAALQAIIDNANGAPLAADDVARYEALEAQLQSVRKTEEIVKRQAAYGTVITPRVNLGTAAPDAVTRSFDAFLRTGRADDMIQRAQSEGSGAAGGYLVPTTFQNKITEHLKAYGGLMNEAESISTNDGGPLYWLTNDDVLATEASIVPENGVIPTTGADVVFGTRALSAWKYGTGGASNLPLKVSYELLQDSAFDITGFLAKKMAERIARKFAVDLISGSGVAEPQGLLNGSLTNSGVTLASATAPTYAELLSIVHSLDPAYRAGAKWLFNDATLAAIEGIVDTTGRPLLWNAGTDLSGGFGLTLLGFPVVIDQGMPALTGSTKVIVFGNLHDAYIVRQVKGFAVVTLNELYAINGQVGYFGWMRADGMVQDPFSAVYATSHS